MQIQYCKLTKNVISIRYKNSPSPALDISEGKMMSLIVNSSNTFFRLLLFHNRTYDASKCLNKLKMVLRIIEKNLVICIGKKNP